MMLKKFEPIYMEFLSQKTLEQRIKILFKGIDERVMRKFKSHVRDNKEAYEEFESIALGMIKKEKKRKCAAKSIVETMRWNSNLSKSKDGNSYQINNNYASLYARFFIAHYPQFYNFFELRPATGAISWGGIDKY